MNTRSFHEHLEAILRGKKYESNTVHKKRVIETDRPIVLFGAGDAGTVCCSTLTDWNCASEVVFCDNGRTGTKMGREIISFETLIKDPRFSGSIIVISIGPRLSSEVQEQLLHAGIPSDRILFRDSISDKVDAEYIKANQENLKTFYARLGDDLSRRVYWKKIESALYCRVNMDCVYEAGAIQYFDPCCRLSEEEVFVDGGSYDGDTVLAFIKRTNNRYRHIFAFEPDMENCKTTKVNTSQYDRITVVGKGLWDRETTLRFSSGAGGTSKVSGSGEIEVPVTNIDSLLETAFLPTFIKMDIEGSELVALRGCVRTIREHRPKLAISVYHKPTDMVELPTLIGNLNPDYTFYLRHYEPGCSLAETVLYAV